MIDATRCRFCGAPSAGLYEMDEGCACFPDDRVQALCLQHAMEAEPIGSFEQIAKWVADGREPLTEAEIQAEVADSDEWAYPGLRRRR